MEPQHRVVQELLPLKRSLSEVECLLRSRDVGQMHFSKRSGTLAGWGAMCVWHQTCVEALEANLGHVCQIAKSPCEKPLYIFKMYNPFSCSFYRKNALDKNASPCLPQPQQVLSNPNVTYRPEYERDSVS